MTEKNCIQCDKQYKVGNYKADKSKYCSKKCMNERNRGENHPSFKKDKTYTCLFCGSVFERIVKRKYCSVNCYILSIKKPRSNKEFNFDGYKHVEIKAFLLPAEVQKLMLGLGLRDEYLSSNFRKYSVKEYGFNQLRTKLIYDDKFQRLFMRRFLTVYESERTKERWLNSLKASRYCFYEKKEVEDFINQRLS